MPRGITFYITAFNSSVFYFLSASQTIFCLLNTLICPGAQNSSPIGDKVKIFAKTLANELLIDQRPPYTGGLIADNGLSRSSYLFLTLDYAKVEGLELTPN